MRCVIVFIGLFSWHVIRNIRVCSRYESEAKMGNGFWWTVAEQASKRLVDWSAVGRMTIDGLTRQYAAGQVSRWSRVVGFALDRAQKG